MSSLFGAITTEVPKFTSVFKSGEYEIRKYACQIRASTDYMGDGPAFRTIAKYIFGGNRGSGGGDGSVKVAMTAPVLTTSRSGDKEKGDKVAMTAPVVTSKGKMSFIMPAEYTSIAQLPVPLDSSVTLEEVPEYSSAVIQFSGWATVARAAAKETQLRAWCARDGVTLEGAASLAQYNPPWTLLWRTNEVMINVSVAAD